APSLFSVAQIANLPYRRLQISRALAVFRRSGQGAALQDGILRYSAARRSRNQSSADWESAVSRIGNPQTFADCQSAKQQIDNLRYEKSSRAATISGDTDRLAVCATNTYVGCHFFNSLPAEVSAAAETGPNAIRWGGRKRGDGDAQSWSSALRGRAECTARGPRRPLAIFRACATLISE